MPTTGFHISTVIFGFFLGRSYKYLMKNCQRTANDKELCRPLAIVHEIFIGSPQQKSKYQGWYLTLCCVLEVHNLTQALKSVKVPGNTFCLKCLGGILQLKPTTEFHISTVIFGFFLGRSYKYLMKNCQRTAKFFLTWFWSWSYQQLAGNIWPKFWLYFTSHPKFYMKTYVECKIIQTSRFTSYSYSPVFTQALETMISLGYILSHYKI
jgi:hypothetical protein